MQMEKLVYNCPFPAEGTVELSIMFFTNYFYLRATLRVKRGNYFFQSIFSSQMTISISGYAYQNK